MTDKEDIAMLENLKHRRLRKPVRIILEALACVALFIGMIAIFAGAVLQESYKLCPVTAEEMEGF